MELARIGERDKQEIFDFVAVKIIAQGKPSMAPKKIRDSEGNMTEFDIGQSCAYLSPDGSRCAVGHLLSDDELKQVEARNMNIGFGAGRLLDVFAAYVPPDTRSLLTAMQTAHDIDAGESVDVWLETFVNRMSGIAGLYNLNTKALSTALAAVDKLKVA